MALYGQMGTTRATKQLITDWPWVPGTSFARVGHFSTQQLLFISLISLFILVTSAHPIPFANVFLAEWVVLVMDRAREQKDGWMEGARLMYF